VLVQSVHYPLGRMSQSAGVGSIRAFVSSVLVQNENKKPCKTKIITN